MKCACPQRLDRSGTIQSPGTTPDAAGHVDLTQNSNWTSRGIRKFRFLRHGGREGRVFDQVQSETTHVMEMQADVLTKQMVPKWRVKYGSSYLNITAIYESPEMPNRRLYVEAIEAR